jgi:hypothetical protein
MAACEFDEAQVLAPAKPAALNASILNPALRRVIRRYRTRFAESFGRQDIGLTAWERNTRQRWRLAATRSMLLDWLGIASLITALGEQQIARYHPSVLRLHFRNLASLGPTWTCADC